MALVASALLFIFVVILARLGIEILVDTHDSQIRRRLGQLDSARPAAPQDMEMLGSFAERVIRPLIKRLIQAVGRRTPRSVLEDARAKLESAGNPLGLKPAEYVAIRNYLSLIIPLLLWAGLTPLSSWWAVVVGVSLAGMMRSLPDFILRNLKVGRDREIERSLPDVLDLLTVSVEAGLGFDLALARVGERVKGPLADILNQVLAEVRLGKPRREALREMARSSSVRDLASVATALIQAEQLGVSIGNVLRIQADQVRIRRRQRAEEAAMKAPIKMLFPMVFFIFPAMFVVLMGPAVIRIISTLAGM